MLTCRWRLLIIYEYEYIRSKMYMSRYILLPKHYIDRHIPCRLCSVVWEKLDQIDGNTEYADSEFCRSSRCGLASGLPSGEAQNA